MKLYHYGPQTGVFRGATDANDDQKKNSDDQARYNNEVRVINGMNFDGLPDEEVGKLSDEQRASRDEDFQSQRDSLVSNLTKPGKYYLIPANATKKKPPETTGTDVAVFDGSSWSVKANNVGKEYHIPGQEGTFKMEVVGDLPAGAVEGAEPQSDDEKWLMVRIERNQLLSECDWTQLPDSPLSPAEQGIFATYRQGLRDVPQDNTDPESISWPSLG